MLTIGKPVVGETKPDTTFHKIGALYFKQGSLRIYKSNDMPQILLGVYIIHPNKERWEEGPLRGEPKPPVICYKFTYNKDNSSLVHKLSFTLPGKVDLDSDIVTVSKDQLAGNLDLYSLDDPKLTEAEKSLVLRLVAPDKKLENLIALRSFFKVKMMSKQPFEVTLKDNKTEVWTISTVSDILLVDPENADFSITYTNPNFLSDTFKLGTDNTRFINGYVPPPKNTTQRSQHVNSRQVHRSTPQTVAKNVITLDKVGEVSFDSVGAVTPDLSIFRIYKGSRSPLSSIPTTVIAVAGTTYYWYRFAYETPDWTAPVKKPSLKFINLRNVLTHPPEFEFSKDLTSVTVNKEWFDSQTPVQNPNDGIVRKLTTKITDLLDGLHKSKGRTLPPLPHRGGRKPRKGSYESMTKAELVSRAAKRGIKVAKNIKKDALIAKLRMR